MTVKHWNTGASAERYRENERASERKNTILNLHSIWLKDNGYKNWKECERASKKEKRGNKNV
jgi:predicted ferric reductase